jgi:hypothetical protein
VADALCPLSDTVDFDSFVISTKCNCLEWDEASLDWFASHARVPLRPHARVRAPALAAARRVAEMLRRAGLESVLRASAPSAQRAAVCFLCH